MDAAGRVSGSRSKVSVIIATYDWSAVLRRALRSVALQTFSDFEVLVVGDHCADDSQAAVGSFGDARFQWHNLDRHYGGQWAPNNYEGEIRLKPVEQSAQLFGFAIGDRFAPIS